MIQAFKRFFFKQSPELIGLVNECNRLKRLVVSTIEENNQLSADAERKDREHEADIVKLRNDIKKKFEIEFARKNATLLLENQTLFEHNEAMKRQIDDAGLLKTAFPRTPPKTDNNVIGRLSRLTRCPEGEPLYNHVEKMMKFCQRVIREYQEEERSREDDPWKIIPLPLQDGE